MAPLVYYETGEARKNHIGQEMEERKELEQSSIFSNIIIFLKMKCLMGPSFPIAILLS